MSVFIYIGNVIIPEKSNLIRPNSCDKERCLSFINTSGVARPFWSVRKITARGVGPQCVQGKALLSGPKGGGGLEAHLDFSIFDEKK